MDMFSVHTVEEIQVTSSNIYPTPPSHPTPLKLQLENISVLVTGW